MKKCHFVSWVTLALLLSFGATAASANAGEAPQATGAASCASPSDSIYLPTSERASLLFYAIPAGKLSRESNAVRVRASIGDEVLLVEELATGRVPNDAEYGVFEFLASHAVERQEMARLNERAGEHVRMEVSVNGEALLDLSLSEFVKNSDDVLSLGVLPTAAEASVERKGDLGQAGRLAMKFYVCGDGTCSPGSFPSGEDCETCPQDCGGPCSICGNNYCGPSESCQSCSSDCGSCCPTTLPQQTRTELISTQFLYSSCLLNVFYPFEGAFYDYTQLNYKRYKVNRVRECDGSITETVVPGSTTYFTQYCYHYTGWYCGSSAIYPSCYFL